MRFFERWIARRAISVVIAIGVALVVIGGAAAKAGSCSKQEGGTCKGGEQICADHTHALVCRAGFFASVSCPGPLACSKFENHVNCDTSIGNPGDNCMGEFDEFACSTDKKQAVVCKNGKFETHLQCRGPGGCVMAGRSPNCDLSLAAKGDPCKMSKTDTYACSTDGTQVLGCRNGKFDTFRFCRGANGCTVSGQEGPLCDESLSQINDPCTTPGQIGCSTDGKTELVCQGGVFMRSRSCKTSCTIVTKNGRSVDCR